jgi:SAM-dependent methyltransferase
MYEAIYSVPAVARRGFFNGGYHPPAPRAIAAPGLETAVEQAAMYDFALRALPLEVAPEAAMRPVANLLDIGCGAGGGLLYAAAAFPDARLAGLDASAVAIRHARRWLRPQAPELRRGSADRLPFAASRFDRVVSIGTLNYVDHHALMAEAARVLVPGGLLSLTGGSTDTPIGWTRQRLDRAAIRQGLVPRGFREITEPCFAAFLHQAPRNAALVARLPWFLRESAREWAVLPGSQRHMQYLAGRKREYAAVYEKPLLASGALEA